MTEVAGELYAPIVESGDGMVEVQLADNHPGKDDAEYRARRNSIAGAAVAWNPGQPTPVIEYSSVENEVWAVASGELAPLHEQYACREYLEGKARLQLPVDAVPQLHEVSELLEPLTGWRYEAAPGLVPLREFYDALGRGIFHSTQYLRHHSQPLYTPEPDIIHEVIGHGNQLAHQAFADLTRAAGQALVRQESDAAAKFIADVFWFTMEFGVVQQDGIDKAYGAGILSSFGEMRGFQDMDIRPLNIPFMGVLDYDITEYQPVLFRAESVSHLSDVVGSFFETVDDDKALALGAGKRLTLAQAEEHVASL